MAFSEFDDLAWHILRLRRARECGRLVFVLGSGINAPYGLPDWSTLLVDLLLDSGRIRKAKAIRAEGIKEILHEVIRDPLLQAVAVRAAFAGNDQWLLRLTERLNRYDRAAVENPNLALGKVARLVVDQYVADRHRHIPILTFNYDDLLETALRATLHNALPRGERHRADALIHSISDEKPFFGSIHHAGIYVYHLHGFVHHHESDIVLDAASYVSILSSPGRHWSWHCMNTYLFHDESAALFLGLSLLDPSLRLLLTQAAVRGLALSGIYVSKPFPLLNADPPKRTTGRAAVSAEDLEERNNSIRNKAFAAHDIVQLFDTVLRELSLVPYHVKSWDELPVLLDHISAEEDD